MTVLISHTKRDRGPAREAAVFLAAENLSVRFDEWETAAGESIVGQVEQVLRGCSSLLVLWSKHSAEKEGEWVHEELRSALLRAITDRWLRVVPVLLDETPLPDLLADADIKKVRFRTGEEPERRELIRAVSGRNPSADLLRVVLKKYHEVARRASHVSAGGSDTCPKCGSRRVTPWDDVQIEYDTSKGQADPCMWLVPAVRCGGCGWERRLEPGTRAGF